MKRELKVKSVKVMQVRNPVRPYVVRYTTFETTGMSDCPFHVDREFTAPDLAVFRATLKDMLNGSHGGDVTVMHGFTKLVLSNEVAHDLHAYVSAHFL
jgi:hypothetical protein